MAARSPWTRAIIEKRVKSFFLEPWKNGKYYRSTTDLEDPFCTLDQDLTFTAFGRVEFFEYIEKQFEMGIEDKFLWNCQRLDQIYAYLERRLITEGGEYRPRVSVIVRSVTPSMMEQDQSALPEYNGPKLAFLFPGQGII